MNNNYNEILNVTERQKAEYYELKSQLESLGLHYNLGIDTTDLVKALLQQIYKQSSLNNEHFQNQLSNLEKENLLLRQDNESLYKFNSISKEKIYELNQIILDLENKLEEKDNNINFYLSHFKSKIRNLEKENCYLKEELNSLLDQINGRKSQKSFLNDINLMKEGFELSDNNNTNRSIVDKTNDNRKVDKSEIIEEFKKGMEDFRQKIKEWNDKGNEKDHIIKQKDDLINLINKEKREKDDLIQKLNIIYKEKDNQIQQLKANQLQHVNINNYYTNSNNQTHNKKDFLNYDDYEQESSEERSPLYNTRIDFNYNNNKNYYRNHHLDYSFDFSNKLALTRATKSRSNSKDLIKNQLLHNKGKASLYYNHKKFNGYFPDYKSSSTTRLGGFDHYKNKYGKKSCEGSKTDKQKEYEKDEEMKKFKKIIRNLYIDNDTLRSKIAKTNSDMKELLNAKKETAYYKNKIRNNFNNNLNSNNFNSNNYFYYKENFYNKGGKNIKVNENKFLRQNNKNVRRDINYFGSPIYRIENLDIKKINYDLIKNNMNDLEKDLNKSIKSKLKEDIEENDKSEKNDHISMNNVEMLNEKDTENKKEEDKEKEKEIIDEQQPVIEKRKSIKNWVESRDTKGTEEKIN